MDLQTSASFVRQNSSLDDVAAVIGFTATLRLVAWYGDTNAQVYVPETAGEEHDFARLIGIAAFRRLVGEWGGEHLALPTLDAYEEDCRNRRVKLLLERSLSPREIGRIVGLGERRVQQIRRTLEDAGFLPLILR